MKHGAVNQRDGGFDTLLDQCLGVRQGEQVVLLTDEGTDGRVVSRLIESIGGRDGIPLVARMPVPPLPGSEPPRAVAAMMAEASAVIELTSLFIGSSRARRDATERGVGYLAMPGVVLTAADLLFMGRGPLREPVVLHVEDGNVVGIEGAERARLTGMLERCADEQMANLAEVSMAFNPAGTICEVPMETESARGTAHVALGNSIAYGRQVNAVAHLDCVMRDGPLELDGRAVMIEGDLQ